MKALPRGDNMGILSSPILKSAVLLTHLRRGKSGGQVRDEYRDEYDPGRGGYGRAIAEDLGDDRDLR